MCVVVLPCSFTWRSLIQMRSTVSPVVEHLSFSLKLRPKTNRRFSSAISCPHNNLISLAPARCKPRSIWQQANNKQTIRSVRQHGKDSGPMIAADVISNSCGSLAPDLPKGRLFCETGAMERERERGGPLSARHTGGNRKTIVA